ncbi:MAG TPA: hypothetical protein VMX13_16925 [Sedimentisphaerales bacterium]|nr:hypothetical protein [Sedimentisphaerales bacterium]
MENQGTTGDMSNDAEARAGRRSVQSGVWDQPLTRLMAGFLATPAAVKSFFSLTGGSILYCLSAMSILYGIVKIMTPLLAKSNAFSDALPCILAMNVYELALLGVLVTIVVWKHVTDDAISLVVLAALFLIASGIVLGTGAYHAPVTCLYIGLVCTAVGVGKLYILRRFILVEMGRLVLLGITLILVWNFFTPAFVSALFDRTRAEGPAFREYWFVAWMVLLAGGALITMEALRRKISKEQSGRGARSFVHGASMVWVFGLVVLAASSANQYAVAYMYRIPQAFGDYVLLIAVISVVGFELMRSIGKDLAPVQIAVCCLPLGCTLWAIFTKSIMARPHVGFELLWYPPVMLGLIGGAILWLGVHHYRYELIYVAILYGLGSLLTIGFSADRPYELNWHLAGVGIVALLFVLGVLRRNVLLCFGAVIVLTLGAATSDAFGSIAKSLNLTFGGAMAGVAGLGTTGLCLAFGKKTPRAITLFASVLLMVSVFDYLGRSLTWTDIPAAGVMGLVCGALWLRTRDMAAPPIICVPLLRKLYMLLAMMSSWGFVLLSFVLLFAGAAVSLFLKRTNSAREALQSK